MKSIKPGRGPSKMSGIGSIFVALFGVFWTLFTLNSGFGFMAIFGIIFIIFAIVQAVYHFKNATSKNRYSILDITDAGEEIDPLQEKFGKPTKFENTNLAQSNNNFCPYCGEKLLAEFRFCNKCGKELP